MFTAIRVYCTRPYDQGRMILQYWNSCLFVERFDTTDVNYIVHYSFLEANRAIIIDLCDLVGTVEF
jgi:hypothetical protein